MNPAGLHGNGDDVVQVQMYHTAVFDPVQQLQVVVTEHLVLGAAQAA